MNNQSGPHLVAAFFCEKVLQERDGTLSFIRLTDRVTVGGSAPQMQPFVHPTTLIIAFKAGALPSGKYNVQLQGHQPNGKSMALIPIQVYFEPGEDRGAMVISQFGVALEEEGVYWFDVYFENAIVTRIPLRVFYQRVGPVVAGQLE